MLIEKNIELKQRVFDLMNGYLDTDRYRVFEESLVMDEFQNGQPCQISYERVYEAKKRLCERLQVKEDRDVEIIIDEMFNISEVLALKMYDYSSFHRTIL